MFKKLGIALAVAGLSASVLAEDVQITGTVESKCLVVTDTVGIYGNPTPNLLSTDGSNGGVKPIIRYDVIIADYYKARISHPNGFSESPSLNDVVTWTGSTSVAEVSDAGMSAYDTDKIEFDNITEVDLSIAGSTWFGIDSEADYGYDKAFPAGTYRTVVTAECIAI
tara:strand:- start:1601 stop:2101 length:501 start_codon:yes stop_codon:yes gene_type:complete